MNTVKKCRCIKKTNNDDIKVGETYKFVNSDNRKVICIDKNSPFERQFYDEEYFNEHFEVMK